MVTDAKGRVVYANRAYADMTGATAASDLKTVENLLSDVPEASATISRLASGLRDGEARDGEFRLAQSVRPGADARRALVSCAGAHLQCARTSASR